MRTLDIARRTAMADRIDFCFADPRTRVKVHLNLDRPGRFSIKQKGLVVGHMPQLLLTNVTFEVGAAAQQAIAAGGKKTVHAYVCGTLEDLNADHYTADPLLFERIRYNPKHNTTFVRPCGAPATAAKVVILRQWEVWAAVVRS